MQVLPLHWSWWRFDTRQASRTHTSCRSAQASARMLRRLRESAPGAVLSAILSENGPGILCDAVFDESSSAALLGCIAEARQIRTRSGVVSGMPGSMFPSARGSAADPVPPRPASAEQSNSSIFYGDRLILKLFRRQESWPQSRL